MKRIGLIGLLAVTLATSAQAQWHPHWHPGPIPDPLAGLRRALQAAQQKLDGLNHQVSDISNQITSASGLVNATRNTLNGLNGALATASHQLSQARVTEAQAEGVLAAAQAQLRSLTHLRDQAETALNQAKAALVHETASLMASKLVAYDLTMEGSLTYNVVHGAFYAKFSLPDGTSYDSEKVKDWIRHGQPSLPQINPVELIPSVFGIEIDQTSHYQDRRQALVTANPGAATYFASKRFVDWLSPETAADYVATIVTTGELGADDAAQQAQDMLLLEFQDLMAWAYLQGVQDLESMAAAALEALATHKGFDVDAFKLNLGWEAVNYDYHPRLSGMTELPIKLLPGGAALLDHANSKLLAANLVLNAPHGAYSVVWSSPARKIDEVARELLAADPAVLATKFDGLLNGALDKVTQVNLPKDVLKRLNGLVLQTADVSLPTGPAKTLRKTFQIDPDWIKQAVTSGQFIVDLHDKPIGDKVTALLKPFAMGNEGSSKLEVLEIDLGSGRISCDFSLRHRHSWGDLASALADVNKFATQTRHAAQVGIDDFLDDLDFDSARSLIAARKSTESAVSAAASKLSALANQLQAESNTIPGFTQQVDAAKAAVSRAMSQVHNLEMRIFNESRALSNQTAALGKLLARQSDLNNQVASVRNQIADLRRRLRL